MNNTDYNKLIIQLKSEFQAKRGKGYCYLYKPIETHKIIFDILISLINKNNNIKILIGIENYTQKEDIISMFNEIIKNPDERKNYTKCLNIITHSYLKFLNPVCDCFISIGINDDEEVLMKFIEDSKFSLVILTKNVMENKFINTINTKLSPLNISVNTQKIIYQKIYTPVKEYRYEAHLSDEDRELYTKYDNYIKDSISIFGDIDTIQKCRMGDSDRGLSAMDCCYEVARRNGWDYNIDKTLDYNQQLDEIFNPIALRERIANIFTITNNRKKLLTDNSCKLEIIKSIVEKNINQKILIISPRGEFAYTIQKYLQENNITRVGSYHDEIPDSYMQDSDGNVIIYKTGENKGKPKIFKSQALSTNYESLYNQAFINILSIKAASSNKLSISAGIVILTSPLMDSFFKIKTRFNDIDFSVPNIVYRIYIKDSIEEKSILNEKPNSLITIHNENFVQNVEIDEISGDVNL